LEEFLRQCGCLPAPGALELTAHLDAFLAAIQSAPAVSINGRPVADPEGLAAVLREEIYFALRKFG
jgi:hypothetical protein